MLLFVEIEKAAGKSGAIYTRSYLVSSKALPFPEGLPEFLDKTTVEGILTRRALVEFSPMTYSLEFVPQSFEPIVLALDKRLYSRKMKVVESLDALDAIVDAATSVVNGFEQITFERQRDVLYSMISPNVEVGNGHASIDLRTKDGREATILLMTDPVLSFSTTQQWDPENCAPILFVPLWAEVENPWYLIQPIISFAKRENLQWLVLKDHETIFGFKINLNGDIVRGVKYNIPLGIKEPLRVEKDSKDAYVFDDGEVYVTSANTPISLKPSEVLFV